MSNPGGMNALAQLRHALEAFAQNLRGFGYAFTLPWFDDGRRAERQQADHRANLQSLGAAVGKTQHVVVEAVLFVPHAVGPGLVHGARNPQQVLDKLDRHVLVERVIVAASSMAISQHVLAEQRHPRGAVGLLQISARGQRRAAVEDADVVQTQEAALEDVLARSGPCGSPTR